MSPEIIKIDAMIRERIFARAREVIFSGGIMVYPTDTLYGLGADPRNLAALTRLLEIKRRAAEKGILLLIQAASEAGQWARVTTQAEGLMQACWPGPVTLLCDALPSVSPALTGMSGKIGLRVPGDAFTRELLASLGTALTATSANISGMPDVLSGEDAANVLGSGVELILDNGAVRNRIASTVIDASADEPKILREGAVPSRELLRLARKGIS